MKKEEKLNILFDKLAEELNITKTMLDRAETAYTALSNHIKGHNTDWNVVVYPQGSFELGTVIKPLNSQEQYDVDLVVLVKSPNFNAYNLRAEILELLKKHGRYEGDIENKKPCIRIQYSDSAQFHMDIACAKEIKSTDLSIDIARFDGVSDYYYELSNPKGYIKWFKQVTQLKRFQKEQRVILEKASTEVEELRLSHMRTPLQKAIQILKRHRDIYFSQKHNSDDRPSSIIITTLCAKAYENTYGTFDNRNIYLTIVNMLNTFPQYLQLKNGEYYLENPSNPQENFLNKWNSNQNLITAFNSWISQAREDIINNPEQFIENDPNKLQHVLLESFGEVEVRKALDEYGKAFSEIASNGNLKYDSKTANVILGSSLGTAYNAHTYFGGDE